MIDRRLNFGSRICSYTMGASPVIEKESIDSIRNKLSENEKKEIDEMAKIISLNPQLKQKVVSIEPEQAQCSKSLPCQHGMTIVTFTDRTVIRVNLTTQQTGLLAYYCFGKSAIDSHNHFICGISPNVAEYMCLLGVAK